MNKYIYTPCASLGEACSTAGHHAQAEDYLSTVGQIYRQVPGQDHPLYYQDWLCVAMQYLYTVAD